MKTKNKKNFVILLAAAVVIISALFVISTKYKLSKPETLNTQPVTSTQEVQQKDVVLMESDVADKIKGWKIYRNRRMGFSIKYPADSIAIQREREEDVVFTLKKLKNNPPPFPVSLFIEKSDTKNNDPHSAAKLETHAGITQLEYVEARINSAYGIKTTTVFASGYNYFLNDKDKQGPVLRMDIVSDNTLDISDFVTMLSTFKFER